MPRAFSDDLRQRVVNAVLSGQTRRAVAECYDLAYATVVKWVARFKETGSYSPAQMGGYRKRLLLPHRDFILSVLQEKPHTTLHAMQQALLEQKGVKVSIDTIWRMLRHEGMRFKKKPSLPQNNSAATSLKNENNGRNCSAPG